MKNKANNNTEFPEAYNPHVQELFECMTVCIACARKCLEEGHKVTAGLCAQCADICSLAIKASSGKSEFTNEIMDLCSTVCQRCADECKKMQVKHCQECSEICRSCAETCSKDLSHSK